MLVSVIINSTSNVRRWAFYLSVLSVLIVSSSDLSTMTYSRPSCQFPRTMSTIIYVESAHFPCWHSNFLLCQQININELIMFRTLHAQSILIIYTYSMLDDLLTWPDREIFVNQLFIEQSRLVCHWLMKPVFSHDSVLRHNIWVNIVIFINGETSKKSIVHSCNKSSYISMIWPSTWTIKKVS